MQTVAMGLAPAVQAIDLRKSFGEIQAVDGVSFELPAGRIYGVLGPTARARRR